MKILAIISSAHMGNTRKIAEAMAKKAPVTIAEIDSASEYDLRDYDIVGFGSGIYFGKHDAKILQFAENLPANAAAYTFVFSTSGTGSFDKNNRPLIDLLKSKNKIVLGSFGCKAFDKFGPFKLVGGINKGRPNEKDYNDARRFMESIIQIFEHNGA